MNTRSNITHRLARTILATCFLTIAACAPSVIVPLGPEAWTQPPDEPGPIELIGHLLIATHAGDRGVSTYPVSNAQGPPEFCIAYLDGEAREIDLCTISDSPLEWVDGNVYPWTIMGTWTELAS